jgi:outer membrane receptor protein involved in Fe transport
MARAWIGSFGLLLLVAPPPAMAQTSLPPVVVPAPTPAVASKPRARRIAAQKQETAAPRVARAAPRAARRSSAAVPAPLSVQDVATTAQQNAARFDRQRDALSPRAGANAYDIGHAAIEDAPQGTNHAFDKVLLQAPGVTQDSAASGNLHVRNEHANVQYRINGIMLPDGISGFGQFLETSFVGNAALLTGALPAQYGSRTAGVVDITARSGVFDGGGAISLYGGSRGTITPSFDYGAHADGWDYFVTGRYNTNRAGIENPALSFQPIHDDARIERYFLYASKTIDDTTRLSVISGAYSGHYQIPNNPDQMPSFTAFGVSAFDSSALNENQIERNIFNVIALQKSLGNVDAQVSAFSRYSSVHFMPDTVGDLVFNGNATSVFRASLQNGVQADAAWRIDGTRMFRFGMMLSAERTKVINAATLLPLDAAGDPVDAPFGVVDHSTKTGWLAGCYAQHEWKLTDRLTLNTGLRFDQSWSYVNANQASPRASLVWTPADGTTLHAGYARYFTPPPQALAAPTNLALFANTTQQPEIPFGTPVRPERSHYFDAGIEQKLFPGFTMGLDVYYKRARNLLDDGQFGPALVLTAFNYDRAYNIGVEAKAAYESESLRVYGNVAWARQRATQVSSNQFLFGADEYPYIATHYIYTDHAQVWTASAGASWQVVKGTRLSADMIYGSGLRNGFANTTTISPYAQVNLGASQELQLPGLKPTTLRIDVVNLLDHTYLLRDGSGIGVFAPQYGPRRGIFVGLTQKF